MVNLYIKKSPLVCRAPGVKMLSWVDEPSPKGFQSSQSCGGDSLKKKKVDSLDLSYGTPPWQCDFMAVEASGTAGNCGLVLSNLRDLLPAVPSPGLAPGLWGEEKQFWEKLHNLGEGRWFGLVAP